MLLNNAQPFLPKYRRPHRRSQFNSDPITQGLRASFLYKIQNISQILSQMKYTKTSLSSKTYKKQNNNKILTVFPGQRSHSATRSSFSCTFRPKSVNSKNNATSFNSTCNGFINRTQIQYRPPTTKLNIREMLKKRQTNTNDIENQQMLKNPYYKIMKRRAKTMYEQNQNEDPQLKKFSIRIQTESIKELQTEQTPIFQSFHNNSEFIVCSNEIQKKSETKVYEDIKKYFEQKYGAIRTNM